MQHKDIVDGGEYALVRRGRDRESLRPVRKVRVIDRTKRYLPTKRWRGEVGPPYTAHEPETPAGRVARHMLVEVLAERGYGDEVYRDLDPPKKIVVEPADLMDTWEGFEELQSKREVAKRQHQEHAERRRREHRENWTELANKLEGHVPEEMLDLARDMAKRDPTQRFSQTSGITVTYELLEKLANMLRS
ncbi:MAG: hypothetical protein ABR616_15650 [Dermatophilaceae bacterium]